MKFHELTVWVEAHPGESILIGGGGLIFLLWLLGYFSPAASAPAQDPLAAAYYAAEAQQAVVAGQIQQATIGAARDTAVAGIQANAATAINAANTSAATTINGQNADAAQAINLGLGSDALLATYNNNASLVAANDSNNTAMMTINTNNNNATIAQTAMNTIIPQELALYGGSGFSSAIPGLAGGQNAFATSISGNLATYLAQGYSRDQAEYLTGVFQQPQAASPAASITAGR